MRTAMLIAFCVAVFASTLYLSGRELGAWEGAEAAARSEKRPNKRTYRFNKADQAAARRAVLTKRDLGPGWKGGAKKPDLSSSEDCADFQPKVSDLVATGAAESEFRHPAGAWVNTNADVMQTPQMERLEWKRTFEHPNALRCLRRIAARSSREAGHRFVSLRAISFPKVAPHVKRYRLIQKVRPGSRSIPMLMDFVALGVGRYELTLSFAAPLSRRKVADEMEVRLARILLARIGAAGLSKRPARRQSQNQSGLVVYEVPQARFSLGVPRGWAVLTAEEAYGPQLREAMRRNPELRRFRDVFSAPDSPIKLVAIKDECGTCSTLNVMAIPRTLDWNPRDFEAGAVKGVRERAIRGTKPRVDRVRLPAGHALRVVARTKTPYGPMVATQFFIQTETTAYVVGYVTPPMRARRYAPLFLRSARSLRQL